MEKAVIQGNRGVLLPLLLAAASALPSATLQAGEAPDALALLATDPRKAASLGLHKLTAPERDAWNALLFDTFAAGQNSCSSSPQSQEQAAHTASSSGPTPSRRSVFHSYVESDDGSEIIRLADGAIIDLSPAGGYSSYLTDTTLILGGSQCRLWTNVEGVQDCRLIRRPAFGAPVLAELVAIVEVRIDGALLVLDDERILEVADFDRFATALWLDGSEALLLEDGTLLNLDEMDEAVTVTDFP